MTDSSLYTPIWRRSRKTLQRALLISLPLAVASLPLTRLYVHFVLSRSPFSPSDIHSANVLGVSPVQYTTWMLVLGQVSFFVEWMLKRELRKSRDEVYEATVRSRGKGASRSEPFAGRRVRKLTSLSRTASASRRLLAALHRRVARPAHRPRQAGGREAGLVQPALEPARAHGPAQGCALLRPFPSARPKSLTDVHPVLLTPLSFVPGLSLCVLSAIRSLTLGRSLHRSVRALSPARLASRSCAYCPRRLQYFAAKKMTYDSTGRERLSARRRLTLSSPRRPFQVELFVTEREIGYRSASRPLSGARWALA